MFNSKKKKLFDINKEETSDSLVTKDPFLRAAIQTDTILSGNLSNKLKTMGSEFLDQFASASKYRSPRTYSEISRDMSALWSKDPLLTLKFTVYLRLITRICKFPDGTSTGEVQRGQGLIHESIMRMIWLLVNYPTIFIQNIYIFIAAGSWKDLVTMLQYDAMYNGDKHSFDWFLIIEILKEGLANPNTTHLIKKYLPSIRTKKNCKTIESQADNLVAKAICTNLFGTKKNDNPGHTYKEYRELKSSGTAHQWQQLISQRRFEDINFDTIAGKALRKLVNSKFLENQGLSGKYERWIISHSSVKHTGYVYELFIEKSNSKEYQKKTINAQFQTLLDTAKINIEDSSLICVLDSSGSMSSKVPGINTSAYTVAKTMTLFFSELLQGRFYGHYFEFSHTTELKKFEGTNYYDKFYSASSRVNGNTDFLSIALNFVKILNQGVKEEDFPSGMLVISDGEFDSSRGYSVNTTMTQVKKFRQALIGGGFSKKFVDNFKIILWDIPNDYYGKPTAKFEALGNDPTVIHIGGLDGSIISFLLKNKEESERLMKLPMTTEELFIAAMDQEILNLLSI